MNEEQTLATEIFRELKRSTTRWFYAFLLMVVVEILTIGGFLWYVSLPIDEQQVEIENGEGNANYVGGNAGNIYNAQTEK